MRRLGEAIFIFRLERADDEFGEKREAAHVGVIESEGFDGKCFEQANHTAASAERDGNHGTRAQTAARLQVHARIGFGVIAIDDLRGAETCAGKSGITIDARADIGPHHSSRSAQNDLVIFRQSDGQPIGTRDRDGALGHQLQNFIKQEKFGGFKFRWRRCFKNSPAGRLWGQRLAAANLLVQRGKCQQRLQRIALRSTVCGIDRQKMLCGEDTTSLLRPVLPLRAAGRSHTCDAWVGRGGCHLRQS